MSDEDKKGSASSFIKGTIVGAAIGSALGILFAPKSGKETRQDISDAAKKAKNAAEKQLKKTYKELEDLSKKLSAQAEELKGKAKIELEKLSKKAELAQLKIKEVISSVREGEISEEDVDKAIAEAHKIIDELGKKLKN